MFHDVSLLRESDVLPMIRIAYTVLQFLNCFTNKIAHVFVDNTRTTFYRDHALLGAATMTVLCTSISNFKNVFSQVKVYYHGN